VVAVAAALQVSRAQAALRRLEAERLAMTTPLTKTSWARVSRASPVLDAAARPRADLQFPRAVQRV